MRPPSDDTVLMRPEAGPVPDPMSAPRRVPRGGFAAGAVLVLAVLGSGLWWGLSRPVPAQAPAGAPAPVAAPVLAEPIPAATEEAIRGGSPAVRTVLRFAPNPAILVIDFPTLAEQGRMLNRIAAWTEKAGVPRDRLLPDAELDAAIRASGATADTYYYGHDYPGSAVVGFFALADRDGVALRPEEEDLRRLVARARAEPAGLGALISLPRADPANDITPQTRAAILHHELSHGEYFTSPAYAAHVDAVWRTLLTDPERAAFRTYLSSEGYDPALEDLMKNEMQAYLMHTPDLQFFDPSRLGIPAERLDAIRKAFLAGMPPGWLRDATHLPRRMAAPYRPGRVSRTRAVAATVPPRRRRSLIAA